MKKIFLFFLIVFATQAQVFISCKKDSASGSLTNNPPNPPPNHLPIANAGNDTTIVAPANTVNVDGSASTDPDNNITSYLWTKISGPVSFSIANAGAVKTQITNLIEGVYQLELKVLDAGGLFTKDTVTITVSPGPSIAIQWQKAFGGTRVDIAQSIQPTSDGGYIVAGNTNSQDGDVMGYHQGINGCYQTCFGQTICDYFPDGLVVKLSGTGTIQWQKTLGGSAADNLLSIQSTTDGGYIASGLTYSNDGDVSGYHGGNEADAWVVKLSSSGDIQWQKVLGGSTGCDFANVILPTPDGGYMIAGHTDSHDDDITSIAGERDVWIVKLNSSGAIQWQKTIGGDKSDYAYSFQSTSDGYILAGYTYSNNGDVFGNHGDADAWIVKIDNNGTIQWQKTLGGSNEEIARSIQLTPDGGYIVAGSAKSNNGDVSGGNHGGSDAWIIKLSNSGTIQWQKSLGGSYEEIARSVQSTTDGGYIITGSAVSTNGDISNNHGGQDAWIVKLNSNGAIQWQRSIGGTNDEVANSVQTTVDGGYIIAGQALSNNGDVSGNHGATDAWIVKLKQ